MFFDSDILFLLAVAAAGIFGWNSFRSRPKPVPEPARVVDEKPKASPFEVPKVEPVTSWPPEVRQALMELVAFTIYQGTPMLNFDLKDLQHDQLRLGSYRITVEKVD